MDENQFWVSIWKIIAAAFVASMTVFGGCVGHTDYRIGQAIKDGADPIKAYCALSSNTTDARCIAAVLSK